jgi:hypothetical protein
VYGLRWLRAPLAHFLVGGAVLFRLVHGPSPFAAVARGDGIAPIVVTAADVARLRSDYARDTGLEPTAADEAALVAGAVEEELLFREALARGLDRNDRCVRGWLVEQMAVLADGGETDPDALYAQARALGLDRTDVVVRRLLVQKMRLLAARSGERVPDDDTLRAYYDRHRDDYTPPARLGFWHVFLSTATHGDAVAEAAGTLLARLRREGLAPADAARLGESFAVGPHQTSQSPAQVAKLFGPEFAERLARADARTWSGPVPSPYGAHLVWVEAREPGVPPPFELVRGRVRERWLDEERRERVRRLVEDLARRYPLEVESEAWRRRNVS